MKVLMTADAVGGVLTYALELVARLADHDVEVVLALAGPAPSDEQRRRIRGAPLGGYAERAYALEWMESPWDDVDRSALWLLELVESVQPDLVHLNDYAHGALGLGVPKVVVGHSCVLSWHDAVHGRPAGPEWGRYRDVVSAGIRGADALVAPTRAFLSELRRLYKPTCPCEAIPNGLDAERPVRTRKESFVLGVGRAWDEGKNLAALERVAPRLPWPVVVAGDGSSLGRVDGVRLRQLYARAAVFCAPARYEPFGLAALEAALCGCALVLGDIPTLREVWGDSALYVDPFDDDDLACVLAHCLSDGPRLERLALAARERAAAYSRARMTAAYVDLYERVVAAADETVVARAEVA
jgi:glycogen synthase